MATTPCHFWLEDPHPSPTPSILNRDSRLPLHCISLGWPFNLCQKRLPGVPPPRILRTFIGLWSATY